MAQALHMQGYINQPKIPRSCCKVDESEEFDQLTTKYLHIEHGRSLQLSFGNYSHACTTDVWTAISSAEHHVALIHPQHRPFQAHTASIAFQTQVSAPQIWPPSSNQKITIPPPFLTWWIVPAIRSVTRSSSNHGKGSSMPTLRTFSKVRSQRPHWRAEIITTMVLGLLGK